MAGEDMAFATADDAGRVMWWLTRDGEFRCPPLEARLTEIVQTAGGGDHARELVRAAVLDTLGQALGGLVPYSGYELQLCAFDHDDGWQPFELGGK